MTPGEESASATQHLDDAIRSLEAAFDSGDLTSAQESSVARVHERVRQLKEANENGTMKVIADD
jgi:anti-sigma28 factor (negative regulator of flagellin synthesis)